MSHTHVVTVGEEFIGGFPLYVGDVHVATVATRVPAVPGFDSYRAALMFAAAPELLRAAKLVASFAVSWQPLTPGDIKELTDAIAKAEGR